jgi:hypothetical protein
MVYEGDLLPKAFQGQIIHCDPGPSVCRAYPATVDGAGYKAEMLDMLVGTRNKWFRPDDVCAAPDGSLIVADWYDPGVGGHAAGDLTRGRLFRVTPKGKAQKYESPKYDFSTAAGACEALKSPNLAARYMAWTALHAMGDKAEGELAKLYSSDNPVYRARALWLLGKIDGKGQQYVDKAIADKDANIRIVGIRLARQLGNVDELEVVGKLVGDESPAVRRDCLIALRNNESPKVPELFAALASKHDGKDRWYLEAIGIGAGKRWDECLAAYLEKAGGPDEALKTDAGRDIVWRSRSKQTPALLAKIIQDKATTEEQKPRYFRSFDFLKGPEKDEALKSLLGL